MDFGIYFAEGVFHGSSTVATLMIRGLTKRINAYQGFHGYNAVATLKLPHREPREHFVGGFSPAEWLWLR